MKLIVAAALLTLSAAAMADTFECSLRVGSDYVGAYEEYYRARTATVDYGDFSCTGNLRDGRIHISLRHSLGDNSPRLYGQSFDVHDAELEIPGTDVSCSCSLM